MKELHFENLYSPEYYFETPGFDSRIAILKLNEARNTIGMAAFSLSYVDNSFNDDTTKNIVKIIHIRHAIEDLNNSFDLLMQIPWFFYRIWSEYNNTGSLRSSNLKNDCEIQRNSSDWVINAEKECSKVKVVNYLKIKSNPIEPQIDKFWNDYIYNTAKPFTIRTLCNDMKHKHTLSFEELYKPYDLNFNFGDKKTNLRKANMSVAFEEKIYDKSQQEIGQIKYDYDNDLSIDIEYANGEIFKYEDCTNKSRLLKIKDVYDECFKYYNALIDLFEEIYNEIYPKISILDFFKDENGNPNINTSSNIIDLNNYFAIT